MRTKLILIILLSLLLLSLSHPTAWADNATLSWIPPTTHVDGTPLTDLVGYKVYYGTASGTYTQVVDAGLTATPSTPTYTVINLVTGNTYYFAVTAYNTSGNESSYSNEVSKSFSVTTTTIPGATTTTTTTIPGATSTTTVTVTTTSTTLDTTPPGDVQNFTAVAGDQQITLSWTDPPDLDYAGVRILYRTDRFPTNINDGTLLGDFTGLPNENMSTTQTGLQNGVTYYYSAHSYDIYGNIQSTAQASATPSASNGNLQQTIGGGCGMIFPKDGKPPGPGQAADMLILIAVMVMLPIKRRIQSLKFQVLHRMNTVLTIGHVIDILKGDEAFRLCREMKSSKR